MGKASEQQLAVAMGLVLAVAMGLALAVAWAKEKAAKRAKAGSSAKVLAIQWVLKSALPSEMSLVSKLGAVPATRTWARAW